MLRFVMSMLGGLFTLVTMGLFAAALSIGAVFYIYGRDLPSYESLAQYSPKTISRIYSGSGQIIDEFAVERRLFTPVEEIPDLVKNAFIAAEDQNFRTHPGVDIKGVVSAVWDAAASGGDKLRGASTIPMQVMKNFLLDGSRSAERKVREMLLAVRAVASLGRDHILELYLNEIFLGQNAYGVVAAAQTYFNKSLDELTAGEAAYLAALPKQPSDLHPVRNYDYAVDRRNYVLGRLLEDGYITRATYEADRALPLNTVQSGAFDRVRSTVPPRDYFSDEIRRQLSVRYSEEEFFSGGLSIRATIDPEMQVDAAVALRRALEKFDRGTGVWRGTRIKLAEDVLGQETAWRDALAKTEMARDILLEAPWYPAVVLGFGEAGARIGIEGFADDADGHWITAKDVQWARKRLADGKLGKKATRPEDLLEVGDVVYVRAMTDDKTGQFIRWTLRQVPEVQGGFMAMDVNTGRVIAMQGGFSYQHSVFNRATQARRQPGSSFKPFVYAAALDSGYTPATIVIDAPIEVDTPQGLWKPQNASDKFYGPTPLRTGIEQSRNLMTVRLAQEVGMDVVARYAERFGVYDRMNPFLANSLGAEETTLYRMVAAYAMFANGGERVEPTLVDRIQDRNGATIYRHDKRVCVDCADANLDPARAPRIASNRERVMDAVTAYQLTSMMAGVVERGTARGAINLPVPVAGKTGTTNDALDVWFVGFTNSIVAGCYIGYDTPQSMGDGASGGGVCGPVFQEFMLEATKKYGGGRFRIPAGGEFIKIDRFTGARLSDNATGDHVVAEFFREGEEPIFGVTFDGGFAMGANLPLVEELSARTGKQVVTSTGKKAVVGPKASFGALSSGGLY